MTMRERIARAICNDDSYWDHVSNLRARTKYFAAADRVLEAIREPTDDMRLTYFQLSFKTETLNEAHWERSVDAIKAEDVDK